MSSQPQTNPEFLIQKVYVENLSFEGINTPLIFQGEWKPEASIELNTKSEKIDDKNYEVSLSISITAKNLDKKAFLVEIKQTGIFTLSGFEESQTAQLLGSYCPSTLFPYAREAISAAVTKGGFPVLNLAPINFDALYAETLKQKESQAGHAQPADTKH
ncbi:MAG: protein-export chaperone SecB [Gammaproteobacteria bacterium]|nr:protein-export chaperone SecB [Gammaproteobacteria bacterium]